MEVRVFERLAWLLPAAVSIIFLLIAVGDALLGAGGDPVSAESITGVTWSELQSSEPDVARFIDLHARVVGVALVAFSLASLAISLTAYRRYERWAWYALWTWPLVLVSIIVLYLWAMMPGSALPPPLFSAPILLVLSLLGLLLPLRRVLGQKGIAT